MGARSGPSEPIESSTTFGDRGLPHKSLTFHQPRALSDPVPYPLPKRLFDRAVSAALILFLLPLFALVVGAYALDILVWEGDRGPLFYSEARISRGRVFPLLKFRTLRRDVLAEMRAAGGHARLYEADPQNLTWLGRRILKPWYLDELPQLLNVLRGQLSLVGPRAWPLAMVEHQVAEGLDYRNRIMAVTGEAQVTKGAAIPYAKLDLAYVEACRTLGGWALVRRDLGILRRTLTVLARGEGLAY